MEIVHSIDSKSPTIPYEEDSLAVLECKHKNIHKGQLKLLVGEISFLTQFARCFDTVLYVGAADGLHIPVLDTMFKHLQLRWILFDPCSFHWTVLNWCQQNASRVSLHNTVFTMQHAEELRGACSAKLLFISDIRIVDLCNERGCFFPSDEQVMKDQDMQMNWVLCMQPTACSLKFRSAFHFDDHKTTSFRYLDGILHVQAWARPNSTELRLISTFPYELKVYSSKFLVEAMAYYNQHARLLHGNDTKLQASILDAYFQKSFSYQGMEAFLHFENQCNRKDIFLKLINSPK